MRSPKLTRWLPGLAQYRGYRRAWLRGDLLAGVTVAAYLVPQVMAYADVAGLPPVAGLWAIVGPLAVYGLIGSSRQLSVGPESTTALMTAVTLAPLAVGDPARYAALAALLALLVGVLCLLGALARLGFLADLLSRPVLVGYLAGIAGMMIVSQLGTVTGVPVDGDGFLPELGSFLAGAHQLHWPTLALAAGVLALLLVLARLAPRSPGPLLGILGATAVVAVFSLRQSGIAVVGEVPRGLPAPGLPEIVLGDVTDLVLPAVGIAIVGFSDNVLTARAFGGRRGETVDANQEFAALGAANVTSALLRGFPVSSSGSRTVLGDAVGSRTQLHALAALAVVLLALLAAGPLLAGFPTAALGAIVVYAALRLVDVGEFARIARFRRSELVLALATTAAVLGLGVLYGVLAAVGLSVLDLLRRVARPHDGILGYVPGVAGMHDVDDYPSARWVPGLVVYRYDAPLCFVNAENFRRRALEALRVPGGEAEWLLLNVEAIVDVDSSGVEALRSLHAELRERGVTLALARVKQDLRDDLGRAGLVTEIGEGRLFLTLPTAVVAYLREYAARHGHLPAGVVLPEPSTQALRPRELRGDIRGDGVRPAPEPE